MGLQLFIYLSIHVTFHFSLLFSAVFSPDPWSLLKEACGFLAACLFFFFFPTNMPRFYDWSMKVSLKRFCISINILGNIKDHTLQGARVQLGATAIQASSLLFPLFFRGLVSAQRC